MGPIPHGMPRNRSRPWHAICCLSARPKCPQSDTAGQAFGTAQDYGAGHINPAAAMDPGLGESQGAASAVLCSTSKAAGCLLGSALAGACPLLHGIGALYGVCFNCS